MGQAEVDAACVAYEALRETESRADLSKEELYAMRQEQRAELGEAMAKLTEAEKKFLMKEFD